MAGGLAAVVKANRTRAVRRRVVAIAAVAVIVIGGYMLFLRNSSLFSVDEVEVSGVTANQERISAALVRAAEDMTTLHVRQDDLRKAVSGFPTVATLTTDTDFPHGLKIEVTERPPVAVAKIEGEPTPVSADGYLLTGVEFDPKELPSLDAGPTESARLGTEGAAQAAILGGAPEELRPRLRSVTWDLERGGVVVDLDGAPELRFGEGEQASDKWQAVITVLADPDLGSPGYLDVSVPTRPVSGA
jgi:cell division protein FtsQ